jgi:hypothetical protein
MPDEGAPLTLSALTAALTPLVDGMSDLKADMDGMKRMEETVAALTHQMAQCMERMGKVEERCVRPVRSVSPDSSVRDEGDD